ncbi:Mak10 subunit, NatC N-terminal acetyltransferase-domain-containing protein [Dichotomopilus funicola]|uniref:Mak10 subunit, NatC N-terminal acetyltransferase-domain-containing protein n=1 Tax=Dichotomopilus funicola TaxID=1934379 RepID=A0AAN6V0T9_9PEZI|nr:Mak10 subunit, NatC N-terminal acetyltransferase-domain-containing protein [Dichotomopilus funicola]
MNSFDDEQLPLTQGFGDLSLGNDYYSPKPGLAFEEPPSPMISSEGIIAQEITDKFLSAAAKLEPGELVKDGFFTLFESVGALEVMDPKMDSGCLAPGESLDDDYDVSRLLSPSEVIGIIDQLFSLEMAWHLGYPLSQTLFTSVYVEKLQHPNPTTIHDADFIRGHAADSPRDPMHTVLRAYCLGLLKACYFVNERIKSEHIYEEEDFVTNTYNRSLLESLNRSDIYDEIVTARQVLRDTHHTETNELAQALDFRLQFRLAFLRAIELSELRTDPASLTPPWAEMQAVWSKISKTRDLGSAVPGAFSTKIQRRLASTMPPRPIVQPSAQETQRHFEKLIEDGMSVLNVLNYTDSQSLLKFVLTFQAQKPQPMVYVRALLQNFLFHDMIILGQLSIRRVMDDDLSIVVLPDSILLDPINDTIEAPHQPRFIIASHMEIFRQRAAQSYLDIFRAFCQNRCRVRRTLFHSLQDWEMLQAEAEEIDELLQPHADEKLLVYPPRTGGIPTGSMPLSSWAYHYKLQLMQWTVQLGFELEIYQPNELASMYWYLAYLAQTHIYHIDRIKFFTTHRLETTHPTSPQYPRSQAFLEHTHALTRATFSLALALSTLYTALARLGLLPSLTTSSSPLAPPASSSSRPYSTDALRHEIRMKPFASVSLPDLPSHEMMVQATTRGGMSSTAGLLEEVKGSVANVRRQLGVLAALAGDDGEEGTKRRDDNGVAGEWSTANGNKVFAVGCLDRWKGQVVEGWMKAVVEIEEVVERVSKAENETKGGGVKGEGVVTRLKLKVPRPSEAGHEWWIVPRIVKE